jgi:hypothetical protein
MTVCNPCREGDHFNCTGDNCECSCPINGRPHTGVTPMKEVFRHTERCRCAVVFEFDPRDRQVWMRCVVSQGCRTHGKAASELQMITAAREAYQRSKEPQEVER